MRGRRRPDAAQKRERVGGLLLMNEEIDITRLDGRETADAGADDRGRPMAIWHRTGIAGLRHGLDGGGASELRIAVGQQQRF